MSTHNNSAPARNREAAVLRFISREEQLRLRGQRNYDRYMLFTKGFVKRDSPERAEWQRESAEDVVRDAAWNQRHGRLPGGAQVVAFKSDTQTSTRTLPTGTEHLSGC